MMKKLIVALLLFPLAALALPAEGKVGPQLNATGTQSIIRQGVEGQVVVSDLSARYGEATSRGQVFTVMTAAAGTTIVAANASPVAAAGATILTLYNPIGSGKNLEVIKVYVNSISGTPGAGGIVYNTAWNQLITAAQNATPVANLVSGMGSVARGFTQTALTGGLGVMTLLRPVSGCVPFAGAIAATSVSLNCLDEVEGAIIIPPGAALTLADVAIGTSWLVQASIVFREVPLAQP